MVRLAISSTIAYLSLVVTFAAAQTLNFTAVLEEFEVFQLRYDGSACSNHLADPNYYACCHPLPLGGTADSKCQSVGDDCEGWEENCVCQDGDEDDDDHHHETNGAHSGGVAQPSATPSATHGGSTDLDLDQSLRGLGLR
ncbi:hypothetical protein QFC21_002928 [Naganishia friedmannii]|uniref:Uncharacterized protein n=1 Tax=Naganishia friedmannii TaxID=89922 RepID=A0ACC2VVS0_9TREE|nr:hypothetical protein QFC21_002928 [Naganishia friedmannii]